MSLQQNTPNQQPVPTETVHAEISDNRSGRRIFIDCLILILLVVIFSVLPVFVFNLTKSRIQSLLPKPKTVKTDCYTFTVAPMFTIKEQNTEACEVELTVSEQAIRVIPISITSSASVTDLKAILDKEVKVLLDGTNGKVETEGSVQFAGVAGYGAIVKISDRKTSLYILSDPTGNNSRAFALGVISGSNLSNLLRDLESSWSWKTNPVILSDSSLQTSESPVNHLTITTPCYKIESQVKVQESFKVNDCDLTLLIGKDLSNRVGVHQFTQSDATLAEAISDWKGFNSDAIILSEKDITMGVYNAHQILFKSSASSDTAQLIVFVYTGNRYESVFNHPVNGFEIMALYEDQSGTKVNIDYLLSHWIWK